MSGSKPIRLVRNATLRPRIPVSRSAMSGLTGVSGTIATRTGMTARAAAAIAASVILTMPIAELMAGPKAATGRCGQIVKIRNVQPRTLMRNGQRRSRAIRDLQTTPMTISRCCHHSLPGQTAIPNRPQIPGPAMRLTLQARRQGHGGGADRCQSRIRPAMILMLLNPNRTKSLLANKCP